MPLKLEMPDASWWDLLISTLGLFGSVVGFAYVTAKAVINYRFGTIEKRVEGAVGQMEKTSDRLKAETANSMQDLWQVVDVERRSSAQFREKMLSERVTQDQMQSGFAAIDRRFDRLETKMERLAEAAMAQAQGRGRGETGR